MVGDSGTSRSGETYYYYTCSCRKRGGTCDKKTERRVPLEIAIVKETVRHVLQPDVIASIVDRVMSIYEQEQREDHVLASLQAELKAVSSALGNLMKAIEMGIITPTTRDRLLELEAQKKDVEARIHIHNATRPRIDRERVEFFLASFAGGNPESSEYRRRVITALVHSVTITDQYDPTPGRRTSRTAPTHRRLDLVYNLTDNATSTVSACSDAFRYAPPQTSQK